VGPDTTLLFHPNSEKFGPEAAPYRILRALSSDGAIEPSSGRQNGRISAGARLGPGSSGGDGCAKITGCAVVAGRGGGLCGELGGGLGGALGGALGA
jgi:hypothetical protein